MQGELQQVRQDADRKNAICDLFDNLVRQAKAVRASFARGADNAGRARANFRFLLTQIHLAHQRGSRWTGHFDDQATKLYDRPSSDDKSVSNQEIIAFLTSFGSDPEAKRKIVDESAWLTPEPKRES